MFEIPSNSEVPTRKDSLEVVNKLAKLQELLNKGTQEKLIQLLRNIDVKNSINFA